MATNSSFRHTATPWYRDVKILNILLQVVFAIVFVGGLGLAFYSLATNLEASSVGLDFNVFQRPFGPAITEGISASQPIPWLNNADVLANITWSVWLLALNIAGWSLLPANYRTHLSFIIVTVLLVYTVFGYIQSPREWILWLGVLQVGLWLMFAGYEARQRTWIMSHMTIHWHPFVGILLLIGAILLYSRVELPAIDFLFFDFQRGIWLVILITLATVLWILFYLFEESKPDLFRVRLPTPLFWTGVLVLLLLFGVLAVPTSTAESLAQSLPESRYLFPNSITRAIITGFYNTMRAVVLSIVGSTVLGIFVGIGLLSRNFLARNISKIYVEIFRNTPLLLQLIFIYAALAQILLPAPRQSIFSPGKILGIELSNSLYILNNRGVYLTKLIPTDNAVFLYAGVLLGLGLAWLLRRWRIDLQTRTGEPAREWLFTLPVFLGCTMIGWGLAGTPFRYDYPALQGLNVQGGTQWSIAFFAVFVGLTLYTAAFIADIVRAGIQAVPFGQIEAARSQGFSGGQVMSMVVLPQALRLIIPPLGNQYVNIGKNSSLAISVAFVDTFRVINLANNESGQAVPLFLAAMLLYLAISVTLSVLTNMLNQFSKVRTR